MDDPLVEIRDLVKNFPVTGGILQREVATVNAVAGVDLDIHSGETIGLVGESGSDLQVGSRIATEHEADDGDCQNRQV